jgi:hypothetical protein
MRTSAHHDHASGGSATLRPLVPGSSDGARGPTSEPGAADAQARPRQSRRWPRTAHSAGPSETPCRRCRRRSGSSGGPAEPPAWPGPAIRRLRPDQRMRRLPAASAMRQTRQSRSIVAAGSLSSPGSRISFAPDRFHLEKELRLKTGTCRTSSPKATAMFAIRRRSSLAEQRGKTGRKVGQSPAMVGPCDGAGRPRPPFARNVLDRSAHRHLFADHAGSVEFRPQRRRQISQSVAGKFSHGACLRRLTEQRSPRAIADGGLPNL